MTMQTNKWRNLLAAGLLAWIAGLPLNLSAEDSTRYDLGAVYQTYLLESYAGAFGMLTTWCPQVVYPEDKAALANCFLQVGKLEHAKRNFRNASDCMKQALKLAPTNQEAVKYYHSLKELAIASGLRNEAEQADAAEWESGMGPVLTLLR